MNEQEIPYYLKEGYKFKSRWFTGEIEVIKIDAGNNSLIVRIQDSWNENWNLQHTIWGFKHGEYYR